MRMRYLMLWVVALSLSSLITPAAEAQSYPSRPIRMIVPYPLGGWLGGFLFDVSGAYTCTWSIAAAILTIGRPGSRGVARRPSALSMSSRNRRLPIA